MSTRASGPAGFGPALALTATLGGAVFLVAMSLTLLLVHPGSGFLARTVIIQDQSAKTALYLGTFALILPAATILVPRLADAIAAGPNAPGLPALSGALAGSFALVLVLVRLSSSLPWGDGLGTVLAAFTAWSALAAAVLWRAARRGRWSPMLALAGSGVWIGLAAGVLVAGVVLCVSPLSSMSGVGLVIGVALELAVLLAYGRLPVRRAPRSLGAAVDGGVVLILLLAIPNVVVFTSSGSLPNVYFPPGIIQFQQDWILGPTNQLLAGGTLLVSAPSSQYGVGLVYFLAGWFHIAPIGYGTFGLLDGILTALFYVCGYCVLRIAGVGRMLAASALGLGVVVLIYNLHFPVGSLPEQGPLRFGLPIAVILAIVAAARWPRHERTARAAALVVVGVASIWALEAFAYTAFTFAAMVVAEGSLRLPGARRRWIAGQLGLGLAAFVAAQLILAIATLAATGQFPHWSQYLAYVHGLLLGGREGSITYGFAKWSPGLAVGAACLVSAAATVLLIARGRELAARRLPLTIALAGTTAYAIATFSYSDNRSSTYLLLYLALPLLIAIVMWLELVLSSERVISRTARLGSLGFVLSIGAVMLAAAWPAVGANFSQSALAHFYPGGGLRASLHRLWHPPPIDPRAPGVERLINRYMAQRRVLVLLPTAPDLPIEAMMRDRRANALFLGDPSEDVFIPSVWMPVITRQIESLRSGRRVLLDRTAMQVIARLRGEPPGYPLAHPVAGGNPELEWILHQIDLRFALKPIAREGAFVVAELAARRP